MRGKKLREERGYVLIVALLLLLITTLIGISSVNTAVFDNLVSGNKRAATQAFYVAEAGIEHAKTFLIQNLNQWNNYTTPQTLLKNVPLSDIGTYTVTIQDGGNNSRKVTSTGLTSDNAKTVITVLMKSKSLNSGYSILMRGNVEMKAKKLTSEGSNLGVHGNGNIKINDKSKITVSGNFTCSGNLDVKKMSQIDAGGTVGGNQPTQPIPDINPADYFDARDYLLTADGKVYDKNGVEQSMSGDEWGAWKYHGGGKPHWEVKHASSPVNATYYVQADVKIKDVGSKISPWVASIIATGTIKTEGKVYIRPPNRDDVDGQNQSLFRSPTENILFLAGLDVKLKGTVTDLLPDDDDPEGEEGDEGQDGEVQGIIAAHEKIELNANLDFTGFIIAQNATGTDKRFINKWKKTIKITYNGFASSGGGTVWVVSGSWRNGD